MFEVTLVCYNCLMVVSREGKHQRFYLNMVTIYEYLYKKCPACGMDGYCRLDIEEANDAKESKG